ncbi:MAG: hypothetical protein ACHQNV_04900, partial [Vicinamibacteria bacterium]
MPLGWTIAAQQREGAAGAARGPVLPFSPRARRWLLPIAFGAVFVYAYLLTYQLRMPDWGVPAFFMPSGVLLAALLVTVRRRWWTYLLAAATGSVLVHLLDRHTGGYGILLIPFYLSGAALAAMGIRRHGGMP